MKITVYYHRNPARPMTLRVTARGNVTVSALLGTPRRAVERFVGSHRDWIDAQLRAVSERGQAGGPQFCRRIDSLPEDGRRAIAQRLRADILALIDRHAPAMGVDGRVNRVAVKHMRSRWGSCNPRTGNLSFSVYLADTPPLCLEYVVVHELAHCLQPNHSPAFYAVVASRFPRWPEARAILRDISRGRPAGVTTS